MQKLLAYLNSLDADKQAEFAEACGTSVGYLRKACSKGQVLGPALCVKAEVHSKKAVRRWDLRDDWADVWPEIVGTRGAPSISTAKAAA